MWYLCPELIVLAMFDSEVPNGEKAAMARALLQHPVPDAFAPGKPGCRHFEQIMPKLADFIAGRVETPCLSTFITDRSWLSFHLVGRSAEGWLQRTPEEWPQNPDYIFMSEVARDMLVVNDCAERNIKAIADYICFTRDVNGMLDDIVLVGEDRHSLIPNLSRENLLHA